MRASRCTRGPASEVRARATETCRVARECISAPTVAFRVAISFLTLEGLPGGDDPVGVFNGRAIAVRAWPSPFDRSARRAHARWPRVRGSAWQRGFAADAAVLSGLRIRGGRWVSTR